MGKKKTKRNATHAANGSRTQRYRASINGTKAKKSDTKFMAAVVAGTLSPDGTSIKK